MLRKGMVIQMNTEAIRRALPEGVDLVFLESVDSTNRFLCERARAGEKRETFLIADGQTEGKGRFDRCFFSPTGTGVYMSFLLYPTFDLSLYPFITPLCGVAAAEAAEEVSGKAVEIKWVNDIYADGKKLGGILAEAGRSHAPFLVLGIGVNAYTSEDTPPVLCDKISSLWGKRGEKDERDLFVSAFLKRFFAYYGALPERTFMAEYRRRSLLIGKRVKVHNAAFDTAKTGEGREALCLDITEDGGLLAMYENGEKEVLRAGEVTLSI